MSRIMHYEIKIADPNPQPSSLIFWLLLLLQLSFLEICYSGLRLISRRNLTVILFITKITKMYLANLANSGPPFSPARAVSLAEFSTQKKFINITCEQRFISVPKCNGLLAAGLFRKVFIRERKRFQTRYQAVNAVFVCPQTSIVLQLVIFLMRARAPFQIPGVVGRKQFQIRMSNLVIPAGIREKNSLPTI